MDRPIYITELHDYLATFVATEVSGSDTLYDYLMLTCREIRLLFDELPVATSDERIQQITSDISAKCDILVEQQMTLTNGSTHSIDDCKEWCDCKHYDSCVTCSMRMAGFNVQNSKSVSRALDMDRLKDFSEKMRFCGKTLPLYVDVILTINS